MLSGNTINYSCEDVDLAIDIVLDYYRNTDIGNYPLKNVQTSYSAESTWIMSYAADDLGKQNMNNLMMSAIMTGLFDKIITYGKHNIDPNYLKAHQNIFSQEKGNGYWLWRPYLISNTLHMMPENDVLVYADNSHIIRDKIKDILALTNSEDIIAYSPGHTNKQYMKKIVVDKLFAGNQQIRDNMQLESSFIIFKNTVKTRTFVSEWKKYCEDPILLTDTNSPGGDYPDFKEHRYDQALFSAVYYKQGFTPQHEINDKNRYYAEFTSARSNNCSLIDLTFDKQISKTDPLYLKKSKILDNIVGCRVDYPKWHPQNQKLDQNTCINYEKLSKPKLNEQCDDQRFALKTLLDYYKNTDVSKYQVKTQRSYKSEKTWIISYASHGIYKQNENNLMLTALMTGLFEGMMFYGPQDINPKYFEAHQDILTQNRGAGFWLWKPYVILKTLNMLNDNDIIIWADYSHIIRDGMQDILELMKKNDLVAFTPSHTNRQYMKKVVVDKLFSGVQDIRDKLQLQASFLIFRNNAKVRNFVSEWLTICEDPMLLTDVKSSGGEYPDFKDHRHDQALFTALYYKYENDFKFSFDVRTQSKHSAEIKTRRHDNCSLVDLTFNQVIRKEDSLYEKKGKVLQKYLGCRQNYPEWHPLYQK